MPAALLLKGWIPMRTVIKWIDRISDLAGVIAGILLVASFLLVMSEIVARGMFNTTLYITEEYSGYLMVAITFFALAYTLKHKGHIRMTFLQTVVEKKPALKVNLERYALVVGLVTMAAITYTSFNFFLDSYQSGVRSMQISRTYLAIPHSFIPLGSGIMVLQFFGEILRTFLPEAKEEATEPDEGSALLGR